MRLSLPTPDVTPAHSLCFFWVSACLFVDAPWLPHPPDCSQNGPCSLRTTPCVWSSLSYFKALCLRGNCFPGASQTPHDNTSLEDTSPQRSCLQSWGCGLHRAQPFPSTCAIYEKLLQLKSVPSGMRPIAQWPLTVSWVSFLLFSSNI